MSSWEERMSQRAQERAVVEHAERLLEYADLTQLAHQQNRESIAEYLESMDLTPEQARWIRDEREPIGCACAGSPFAGPDQPCYCILLYMRIEQLIGPPPIEHLEEP